MKRVRTRERRVNTREREKGEDDGVCECECEGKVVINLDTLHILTIPHTPITHFPLLAHTIP